MGISYYNGAGVNTVPAFLRSKTAAGLQRAMLKNNMKHKGFVVYQDIQFAGGFWYVWFYINADRMISRGGSNAD